MPDCLGRQESDWCPETDCSKRTRSITCGQCYEQDQRRRTACGRSLCCLHFAARPHWRRTTRPGGATPRYRSHFPSRSSSRRARTPAVSIAARANRAATAALARARSASSRRGAHARAYLPPRREAKAAEFHHQHAQPQTGHVETVARRACFLRAVNGLLNR